MNDITYNDCLEAGHQTAVSHKILRVHGMVEIALYAK